MSEAHVRRRGLTKRRALVAAAILTVLAAVRFAEGFPISGAILLALPALWLIAFAQSRSH